MRVRPIVLVLVALPAARPAAANDPLPVPVEITTQKTGGTGDPGPLTFTFDPSGTLTWPSVSRASVAHALTRCKHPVDVAFFAPRTDFPSIAMCRSPVA